MKLHLTDRTQTESAAGAASGPAPRGPQFVEEHSGNVTARVNGSVILNCRVRWMASRQVSWGRGFEVLTGGLMLFTGDRRFQPLHQEYSEDWGLRILSVRHADAGWYFCQVSTSPPVSHYLHLTVVEPDVEILGGPELYINQGSTANLTCVIRRAHKVPENVRWTHDDKLVEFDRSRTGVRVRTSYERQRTVSSVIIKRASAGRLWRVLL
ncbi:contactin-4-like [Pollicipes pollicipes]|uniref:contactin-4-like n=1 Tax=Pollicipes pollicipes TaxID=41117 RepID=UPI0018850B96|nr:contactin-4-like [Pollicipes pollicipes]